MALGVVNLHYFLVGVFFFLFIKFVDRFKYFEDDELVSHDMAKVWNFIFGAGLIFVGINGIFALVTIYSTVQVVDYRNLMSTILIFTASGIFLSDSLKNPSKNYLIALGIGCLISAIGAIIPFIIASIGPDVVFGQHVLYINYILLIPFIISIMIGFVVALVIFHKRLKPRREEWNKPIWDKTRAWNVINNQMLLLALSIIVFIEVFFQWHSSSLLSLFFQLP